MAETSYPEWYAGVPRSVTRHAVFGLSLMALSFGGFGLWAFRAPLAAAVISQGSFVATGQNKIVQHLEGGIIREILVEEGDRIEAGQVILRLDETLAQATRRELVLRRARLEATEARLLALHHGDEQLALPQHLLAAQGDPEIAAIIEGQRLAFGATRSQLANDVALVERNIEALEMRGRGYEAELRAMRGQAELLEEELSSKTTLLETGLIRQTEISALRRALLEAEGQMGRIEAEIAESLKMSAKFQTQIDKTHDEYRRAALAELQAIQGELESVREEARKAENVLTRTEVPAPVAGTVVRLHYHTPGGVIETGKPIAEILPADAPLIVEVLVPRNDIDSVKADQPATVRLVALNQRTTPVLNGRVAYVSADSVADASDGVPREVYVARVSLEPEELARVPGFTPTPGMPAEIMIQTAERTFAQYLARPVLDSMARAFREQ
ncbi:HlyD family type I secretion periplasmic adaptor subunit [Cereibacter sphaeroides]|uniref:HlyD family type I secretion periplasmic adaptor subunit n=1 Tax=Cereibacter sphaeroides TaxID=1063 RepID=UPI001F26D5A3|nr:HlyD family type I secretion periplasmic adaptor subunit [Cereibacter sphaeroides]MCE6958663.1 HlyD family type I secretion periplasmic adaptor subunit [Cereibacter sphaeroides]MCE6973454.1 HlyD family type I secretion periplasmic adaptor subunit [Cereibacter sphaeroides]